MSAPEPPVPIGCDMAGNDWFPLHFDRLRKSKWWRRATDMARARNVMLWGEAYKQVPAGSMPDDDDELAEAAGFGMDVESFIAAKADIMGPWVLCSDGRWYHPTVCEVVLEAWEKQSDKRKAAATKKAAQRAKVRGHAAKAAPVPDQNAHVPGDNADVPRDSAEKPGDIDTHNREDRTGEDTQETPPVVPDGDEQDASGKRPRRRPSLSIPDGFPTAEAIAEQQERARDAGANVDAAYQAERFRNWAVGKDAKYADWPATWRNWMLKAVRDAPKDTALLLRTSTPPDPWRERARNWAKNAYWNTLDWGPRPGREGCLCPPEVLREFNIEPLRPRPIAGAA